MWKYLLWNKTWPFYLAHLHRSFTLNSTFLINEFHHWIIVALPVITHNALVESISFKNKTACVVSERIFFTVYHNLTKLSAFFIFVLSYGICEQNICVCFCVHFIGAISFMIEIWLPISFHYSFSFNSTTNLFNLKFFACLEIHNIVKSTFKSLTILQFVPAPVEYLLASMLASLHGESLQGAAVFYFPTWALLLFSVSIFPAYFISIFWV